MGTSGTPVLYIHTYIYTYIYDTTPINLTFRGPCIVIYSYNKTNEMH
jgi:hypothetical protein